MASKLRLIDVQITSFGPPMDVLIPSFERPLDVQMTSFRRPLDVLRGNSQIDSGTASVISTLRGWRGSACDVKTLDY